MSGSFRLIVDRVAKRFSGAPLFAPISIEVSSGEIIAIVGSNGSGKSTLLKILANVLQPTKGSVTYQENDTLLPSDLLSRYIGYTAPYLELYSELTAIEHIRFIGELKGKTIEDASCIQLLSSFGLDADIANSDRLMKQYSSGMQQRVKTAMAFAFAPRIIFLDEPGSNLDKHGIELLFRMISEAGSHDTLIVIATNDPHEAALATRTIALEPYTHSSN